MSVSLGYTPEMERIASLENELDVLQKRPPRNKYTCTVCHGERRVDESYHGSPDFQPCLYCQGGKLIDEANKRIGL
jgi:hypothetical protein